MGNKFNFHDKHFAIVYMVAIIISFVTLSIGVIFEDAHCIVLSSASCIIAVIADYLTKDINHD